MLPVEHQRSAFADVLATHTMPPRLGDVTLRLDTPLLVGEAQRPRLQWLGEIVFWALGASGTVIAVASVLLGAATPVATVLTGIAVALLGIAMYVERRAQKRRAFIINFEAKTLRLDFSTPLTGMPRTWIGGLEQVKDLSLLTLPDGMSALIIDIDGEKRFREVLVAALTARELEPAKMLVRALSNAFGLESHARPTASVAKDFGQGAK